MSLFSNIFEPVDPSTFSGLFSISNPYRRSGELAVPPVALPPDAAAQPAQVAASSKHKEKQARKGKKLKERKQNKKAEQQEQHGLQFAQPELTGHAAMPPAAEYGPLVAHDKKKKQKRKASSTAAPEFLTSAAQQNRGLTKRNKKRKKLSSEETDSKSYIPEGNGLGNVAGTSSSPEVSEDQEEVKPYTIKNDATPLVDTEKLARTVFVGNLPADIRRKAVRQRFSQYGDIDSVRLRSVSLKRGTRLRRKMAIAQGAIDAEAGSAHAYVVFAAQASGAAALQANMQEWDGRHLQVNWASQSGKGEADDTALTLFVGNVPFVVKEEEMIKMFSNPAYGLDKTVEYVRIVRDNITHTGKGFAYVKFRTARAARAALALNGERLKDRPLRVTRCSQKRSEQNTMHKAGNKHRTQSKHKGGGVHKTGNSDSLVVPPRQRAVHTPDWQGIQTKGKFKSARSNKSPQDRGNQRTSLRTLNGRIGKRPAVAARKAAARAGRDKPPQRQNKSGQDKAGQDKAGQGRTRHNHGSVKHNVAVNSAGRRGKTPRNNRAQRDHATGSVQ